MSLRRIAAVCLMVAAGASTFMSLRFGLWPALVFYGGVAIVVVGLLMMSDRAGAVILTLTFVTLGPFAGPVFLLAACGPVIRKSRIAFLPEPEIRQDTRAERICTEITEGRRPRPSELAEPCLAEVFATGSLAEQQTALAAMVRYYAPELRPALDCALASEIPAVRVQAAAVFAHLRDTFAARARALAAEETGLAEASYEAEIAAVAASGFVDPKMLADVPRPMRLSTSKTAQASPTLTATTVTT